MGFVLQILIYRRICANDIIHFGRGRRSTAVRSRSRSDNRAGCHSLRSRRFATPATHFAKHKNYIKYYDNLLNVAILIAVYFRFLGRRGRRPLRSLIKF